jgi:hypothetical protein
MKTVQFSDFQDFKFYAFKQINRDYLVNDNKVVALSLNSFNSAIFLYLKLN